MVVEELVGYVAFDVKDKDVILYVFSLRSKWRWWLWLFDDKQAKADGDVWVFYDLVLAIIEGWNLITASSTSRLRQHRFG